MDEGIETMNKTASRGSLAPDECGVSVGAANDIVNGLGLSRYVCLVVKNTAWSNNSRLRNGEVSNLYLCRLNGVRSDWVKGV